MVGSSASSDCFFCFWEREPWLQGKDYVDSFAVLLIAYITSSVPPKARGMGNISGGFGAKRWRDKGNKISSREIRQESCPGFFLFLLAYHNLSVINKVCLIFTTLLFFFFFFSWCYQDRVVLFKCVLFIINLLYGVLVISITVDSVFPCAKIKVILGMLKL